MRLIFVRHGEPDYANDCLTENGKKQAINVAMRLKDEDISAIFSSPMGRARETASYTAKSHNLEIQNLDFMHEIDWGNKDKNIALFAHGGSGSIMFSHVLSLPFPFALTSMPYGVCSISIIDFTAQNGEMIIPRLELFNDMDHIESYKRETLHFEK
ncbi:histidine phosphatase family protein [Butyrivibrio sp. XPD2002]|uniref:histidine phosphatase family protein n=1 Tax=Butyrivibrio sp. XPD2002 TaxID=1280665 RepID=UPI0003F4DC4B|nr:histidine phosphatase family protein [Butyrivibrio sp. XPD2002]